MSPARICATAGTDNPFTCRVDGGARQSEVRPSTEITLTRDDLEHTFHIKHRPLPQTGWSTRLQRTFDYFTPDDHYEALLAKLVQPWTRWLDAGCGRKVLPSNPNLAQRLASRCRLLVGVDPCDTLDDNPYVHMKVKKRIEDFHADVPFDLVTLRMVAEHIESPREVLASLSRATRPGGLVVAYTVNKWSPMSVVARLVPLSFHYGLKRLAWRVEARDTHPVVYRMNTRRSLTGAFRAAGFRERYFARLDDCRASGRSQRLRYLELSGRLLLRRCSLPYPEACLLAVFERR